jgi:hypothetical protein
MAYFWLCWCIFGVMMCLRYPVGDSSLLVKCFEFESKDGMVSGESYVRKVNNRVYLTLPFSPKSVYFSTT